MQTKQAIRNAPKHIRSNQQSLKLLRPLNTEGGEIYRVKCKGMNHLFKLLAIRNNQIAFRIARLNEQRKEIRAINQRLELLEQEENPMKIRALEEAKRAKQNLSIKTSTEVSNKRNSFRSILLAQNNRFSSEKSKDVKVLDYLQMMGWTQASQMAKSINISNDSNQEDLNTLIQCFNQLLNLDQPIQLFKKQEKSGNGINIPKYISVFEPLLNQMLTMAERKNYPYPYLIQLATNQAHKSSILQKFLESPKYKAFRFILEEIIERTQVSPYDNEQRIVMDPSQIQKLISIFIIDKNKQQKFKGELNPTDFWEKVCYLFRKGGNYNNILLIHLQEYNYSDLIRFLKATLEGKPYSYDKQMELFQRNKYYREFVLLLERNYLEYCVRYPAVSDYTIEQTAYFALKQISLKQLFNEDFFYQLSYLHNFADEYFKKCRSQLLENERNIKREDFIKLLNLGKISQILEVYVELEKFDPGLTLILLGILCQIDHKHSRHYFYSHINTIKMIEKTIFSTLDSLEANKIEVYYKLILAFIPMIKSSKETEDGQTNQIILRNKQLFEYIFERKRFAEFGDKFGLKIVDLPNLLEKSIRQHKNYAFCLQLSLSSCLDLEKIYNQNIQKPQRMSEPKGRRFSRETIDNKTTQQVLYQTYLNKSVSLFLSMNEGDGMQSDNCKVFLSGFKTLVLCNIELLKSVEEPQRYEELMFVNNLYLKLKQKEFQPYILERFSDNKQQDAFSAEIQKYLKVVTLTFDMIRLRKSIANKQFQIIVEVLNSFYEEISIKYIAINTLLRDILDRFEADHHLMIFTGSLIQSIRFLKDSKSKVFYRNKYILQAICQQILTIVRSLQDHDESESKYLICSIEFLLKDIHI